jgi:hypothetical protein
MLQGPSGFDVSPPEEANLEDNMYCLQIIDKCALASTSKNG